MNQSFNIYVSAKIFKSTTDLKYIHLKKYGNKEEI